MKIAVLGARGVIGKNLLRILEEEADYNPDFKLNLELDCFGSLDGVDISFGSRVLSSYALAQFEPEKYDVIFSAIDAALVLPFKNRIEEHAKKTGAIWIDKSSALRMCDDIPLVVPEVNANHLHEKRVAASPNCAVIPVAMFLHAVRDCHPSFVNVVTYQSVSGAGSNALSAFFKEVKSSNMQTLKKGMYYDDPMAFNVIPAIGEIDEESGSCDEEIKIVQELHKILETDESKMQVVASVARVPVAVGHMMSVTFKLEKEASYQKILKAMAAVGIVYMPRLCTPLMAAQEDDAFACRLRKHANNVWSVVLVADNLRKGGALNAWQIAKIMLGENK